MFLLVELIELGELLDRVLPIVEVKVQNGEESEARGLQFHALLYEEPRLEQKLGDSVELCLLGENR